MVASLRQELRPERYLGDAVLSAVVVLQAGQVLEPSAAVAAVRTLLASEETQVLHSMGNLSKLHVM